MTKNRSVRSSQLISPYGPGAIVDIGDESLLLTDLKGWPRHLIDVKLPRLARELGVTSLKAPPHKPEFGQSDNHRNVLAIRFPRWMFCPSCRKMVHWNYENGGVEEGRSVCTHPKCQSRSLVPMRFVMACEAGHMDDVPWDYWTHSGKNATRICSAKKQNLYFISKPELGSGLEALIVQCRECESHQSLGNITSPSAIKSIGLKCTGAQPWESWEDGCLASPVVLQRGASNLYFPVVRSALDIPVIGMQLEQSEQRSAITSHPYFEACRSLYETGGPDYALTLAQMIASDNNCTCADVLNVLQPVEEATKRTNSPPSAEVLQEAEWNVLVSQDVEVSSNPLFSARIEGNLDKHDRQGESVNILLNHNQPILDKNQSPSGIESAFIHFLPNALNPAISILSR